MDLDSLTMTAALEALADGRVSSVELLDAHLARVDADNPALNAVVALDDRARARCAAADAARRAGDLRGPLHGLPITVKDAFETAGLTTTAGAAVLADYVPSHDADAVAALRRAGAVVYGKTNLPTWASDVQTCSETYGLTRNPWDLARTTGGSSGGAAAALAGGMTLLELGSDIAGSIRCPAHYTGVAGHKPTWGALSVRGHLPGPPGSAAPVDLGVVGPMARTVRDLELAMHVLTADGVGDVPGAQLPASTVTSVAGLRVALWAEDPATPTSAAVSAAVRRIGDRLADGGAHVTDTVRPGPTLQSMTELYLQLLMATMTSQLSEQDRAVVRQAIAAHGADQGLFSGAHARGAVLSHAQWQRADESRHQCRQRWQSMFSHVDVVIAPCSPVVAFPHDVDRPVGARVLDVDGDQIPYLQHVVWSALASLPGLPATAVPVGRSSDGLPIGVQVIGPRWGDLTALRAAGLVTELADGFQAPPRRLAGAGG